MLPASAGNGSKMMLLWAAKEGPSRRRAPARAISPQAATIGQRIQTISGVVRAPASVMAPAAMAPRV